MVARPSPGRRPPAGAREPARDLPLPGAGRCRVRHRPRFLVGGERPALGAAGRRRPGGVRASSPDPRAPRPARPPEGVRRAPRGNGYLVGDGMEGGRRAGPDDVTASPVATRPAFPGGSGDAASAARSGATTWRSTGRGTATGPRGWCPFTAGARTTTGAPGAGRSSPSGASPPTSSTSRACRSGTSPPTRRWVTDAREGRARKEGPLARTPQLRELALPASRRDLHAHPRRRAPRDEARGLDLLGDETVAAAGQDRGVPVPPPRRAKVVARLPERLVRRDLRRPHESCRLG